MRNHLTERLRKLLHDFDMSEFHTMGLSNGGVTLRVRRAQEPWNKYGALIVKRRMLVKYLASTAAESAASAKAARRRGTAAANSLGRVVLAVWTTAGLASAASPPAKSARAACGRVASAERCGLPGLLNVGRGDDEMQIRPILLHAVRRQC
ncbi:MAG TPA: hypothetical protein PK992_20220 [Planctomycetaceae bacterium]|nr:hypothetical protein [Planctomycetaceae bacterium]